MIQKSNTTDLAEELTKLAKLHSDGVITDDQFKALKTRIIAGIKENANRDKSDKKGEIGAANKITENEPLTRLRDWSESTPTSTKRFSWYGVAIGIVIAIAVLLYFSGILSNRPPRYDLRVQQGVNLVGGPTVEITNAGSENILIEDVVLNDRPECALHQRQKIQLPRWQDDPDVVAEKAKAEDMVAAARAVGAMGADRGIVETAVGYALGARGSGSDPTTIPNDRMNFAISTINQAAKGYNNKFMGAAVAVNAAISPVNDAAQRAQARITKLAQQAPLAPITATLRTGDVLTVQPQCSSTVKVTIQTNFGTVSYQF